MCYAASSRVFELYASTEDERAQWLRALDLAKKFCQFSKADMQILEDFSVADVDNDGVISQSEVRKLLRDLGIQFSERLFKAHFRVCSLSLSPARSAQVIVERC
jgi:Ca2+-binding EF-hand superfamily protein